MELIIEKLPFESNLNPNLPVGKRRKVKSFTKQPTSDQEKSPFVLTWHLRRVFPTM